MGLPIKDKQVSLDIIAVIAVALMLLWPAIVNGEPFYMPDTSSYVRGADAAIYRTTGQSSAWTNVYLERYSGPSALTVPAPPNGSTEPPVVLAGRSLYYGLLLYGAQWFGNFWAVAVLQALLVAIAIALTIAALRRPLTGRSNAISIVVCGSLIAACTSAGFFASYLLPDVFGGLALLGEGHLIFLWKENGPLARAFWFLTLVCAMVFHASNLLLIGFLTAAAIVFLLLKVPARKVGLCVVIAALMISVAGHLAFFWGVERTTGRAPVRPPFLAARVIADGPGYEYLRDHCPMVRLIFCRAVHFKSRISDALLWSKNPDEGIFQALPAAGQRLAAAQERQFVLAVLEERPLELGRSSIGAFWRQLAQFNLHSFNYSSGNIQYFDQKIPSPFHRSLQASKAYQNRMPVRPVEWMTLAAVLASLVAIFWTLHATIRRTKPLPGSAAFISFMVLGVLLNAAICGAISTPKGRYQMRLVWVLPLIALASRKLRPWEQLENGDGPMPVAFQRNESAASSCG